MSSLTRTNHYSLLFPWITLFWHKLQNLQLLQFSYWGREHSDLGSRLNHRSACPRSNFSAHQKNIFPVIEYKITEKCIEICVWEIFSAYFWLKGLKVISEERMLLTYQHRVVKGWKYIVMGMFRSLWLILKLRFSGGSWCLVYNSSGSKPILSQ